MSTLTPESLIKGYALGLFPMADLYDPDKTRWVARSLRGILPLERFHVPRRLKRTLRQGKYRVTVDQDFDLVLCECARKTHGRPTTWINSEIRRIYNEMYDLGYGHSVEVWNDNKELVGGLYGIALGGVFFGESMFSRERDTSKIALVHLVARLKAGGYKLLDTQDMTDHLRQFGGALLKNKDYMKLLESGLTTHARFGCGDQDQLLVSFLQEISQIS